MSITLIVMLGLPVLYLTGNLRKAAAAAGIGGAAFVLYFVVGGLMCLIPVTKLFSTLSVNFAGVFLFAAPAVYLAVKRDYSFRFFLASSITVLISVSASFVSVSYTITYLPAVLCLAVSILSVLCLNRRAPLYAPVLIGIYGIAEDIMTLLTGSASSVTLFDLIEVTTVSIVICLAASFLIARSKRIARIPAQTEHNKG